MKSVKLGFLFTGFIGFIWPIYFINAEEKQIDIITTYNKGFIIKYEKELEEIRKNKEILKKLQQLEEEERKKEIKKYQEHIKRYIEIDNVLNNSDYVLLVRLNINGLNLIKHEGQKYIFYIKPIYFQNKSDSTEIEKKFRKDLESLFKIDDLDELKKRIKEIEKKYQVTKFYNLFTIKEFSNFFTFTIGRLFDEKIPIDLEDKIEYFNSLYYIPDRVEKYIDSNYIYFYFPVSKEYLNEQLEANITKYDFNKFYCAGLRYDDGFYFKDNTVCSFKKYDKYGGIIGFDFDSSKNMLLLEKINLKIVNRGKELIDILIILSGVLFAFIVKMFLNYLKKEREQHEQDVL